MDAINKATDVTKKAASAGITNAKGAAINKATNTIPPAAGDAAKKLEKLPRTKDSELLKTQAKAEAQKIVGENVNKLQQEKENRTEELKDKVAAASSLIGRAASLFIKAQMFDPKVAATLAFLKAQKELRELKQKVSKDNLKKAKENFTFPMKPPKAPNVPEIPKPPNIPELPVVSIPNIPTL